MSNPSEKIIPKKHQPDLDVQKLIINNPEISSEEVPMDVVFVGGGPAGLSGAIHLARLIKKDNEQGGDLGDVQIGVLEKAQNLGGHTLSGAVLNPRAIRELFPELEEKDFPFRNPVKGDRVYYLTETGSYRMPTPPTMHNKGNYVVSLCEVVRWLGEKAEALGVNVFSSFPADALLAKDGQIKGVRTTPAGLNRDGQPGSQHMPATDITAKVTVLSEGSRGPLTQALLKSQSIQSSSPQIYALGVKEIWKVKKSPDFVTHTMGFPLPNDAFGGSWLYPMGEDMVSFGLVAGLDYKAHNLDVHGLLQRLKNHPFFKFYLEGGEALEWGAKTIPEGGFHAIPEAMHTNGALMIGDCMGLVNVPALKGIHYAMQSGIYAAETIFESLKKKDQSTSALSSYDQKVKSSYIYQDLKKVRNMRNAFKGGFWSGAIKSAVMTVTGGAFPSGPSNVPEDAEEEKTVSNSTESSNSVIQEGVKTLSKVDAVYLSGNKTRDDIPSHLKVGEDVPPEVASMYASLCPAGVYERQGDQLIVNAPNCVDCKATDVLGPRWTPREGGSGPDYKLM